MTKPTYEELERALVIVTTAEVINAVSPKFIKKVS